jgi:hypothetical protein
MKFGTSILAVLLLAAPALRAEDAAAPAAEPVAMKGKIGIGVGTMPGLGPTQLPIFSQVISQPDAVSLRWWVSDKVGLEALLAYNQTSAPSSGSGTAASVNYAGGIGLGAKWNFKRSERALGQLLVGFSVASYGQGPDSTGATTSNNTFSLYVGPGFEVFMPFLKNLSLEGSVRLRVNTLGTKTEGGPAGSNQAAQSSTSLGFFGEGFTPLALSMHYYF